MRSSRALSRATRALCASDMTEHGCHGIAIGRVKPAQSAAFFSILFQDRLTAGCDALNVAMQVRILLLDPIHVAVTGTATAAPAKRVHAGSSPARNSNSST